MLWMGTIPHHPLDQNGGVVAESTGEEGRESIEFNAPEDGSYFLRVDGYRDQAAFYSLTISGSCRLDSQCPDGQVCDRFEGECVTPPESECGLDDFEPNNSDATATQIEAPPAQVEGVICGADRDWFGFRSEAGDSYELLVSFDEGQDIDVHVVDAATGRVVDRATNDRRTNPERLSLAHLPAGEYRIGLTLFVPDGEPDRDSDYTIELIGRSGACETDRDCVADGFPSCVEGTCRPVEPGAGLGERCGDNDDCSEDAELCFTGFTGGHDNFCTRRCQGEGDCQALGETASCVPVGRGTAICYPGCQSDDDCNVFYACREGRCGLRGGCRTDDDCAEEETCRPAQTGDFYCATPGRPSECGADEGNDPNDIRREATRLAFDQPQEGLNICNGDDDWYRVAVPANAGGFILQVGVAFRAGVDIDVYVFDENGNPVGSATSPDQTNEVAEIRYITPGSYYIRVDQFSSDRLIDTVYSISATLIDNDEGCTGGGNECNQTDPLRMVCDRESGGCRALEGNGEVPLGSRCDSNDDCVEDADVCWTFDGGNRSNICTKGCRRDSDCDDVPGTECTRFGRGAACLPSDDE